MRVVARVFNLSWFGFRRAVDNEYTRLVPYTTQIASLWQKCNLSHILAREYLVFSQMEFLVLKDTKVHAIATAEAELIWPFSLDDFVNVASEQFRLVDFDQLLHFSDANHVYVALVFTTANGNIINFAHCKDVTLSHDTIKNLKSQGVD